MSVQREELPWRWALIALPRRYWQRQVWYSARQSAECRVFEVVEFVFFHMI